MRPYDLVYPTVVLSNLNARIQVCWIPILKAKKLILAGDNLQLPPTVKSIDKKDQKAKGKALRKTTGTTTPGGKPTATDAKAKGKVKAVAPSFAPVPTPDLEEVEGVSDDENSDNETEPSPAPKPTEGKTKKPQQLGVLRPSKSLEVTLFDRMEKMWGEDIKQMLTVQYR